MNRTVAPLCIFFLIIINSAFLNAQRNSEINFTEDDGLPGMPVLDVLKDRKGIIWVATNNGIARYDGDEFSHVDDQAGKPMLMASALACGRGDTIYCGSNKGGLAVIVNDSLKKIIHNPDKTSDKIRKLYYSGYYNLLVTGTEDGIFILKDSVFITVPVAHKKAIKALITSFSGRDSLIYFTVADIGLFRLIINREAPQKSIAQRISALEDYSCLLSGNKIYGTSYNMINCSDLTIPSIKSYHSVLDSSFFFWCLAPYGRGLIVAGGLSYEKFKGDVVVYDPGDNSCRPLIRDGNIHTVNSIFSDSTERIVWIARDNGLTAVFESPFELTAMPGNIKIIDAGFTGDSLYVLASEGIFLRKDGNFIPYISKEKIINTAGNFFSESSASRTRDLMYNNGYKELASLEQNGNLLFVSTQKGALSIPDLRQYLPFPAGTFRLAGEKNAYSQFNNVPLRYFLSYRDSISWIEPEGKDGPAHDIDEIIESNGIYYCRSLTSGLFIIKNNIVYRMTDENSGIDNYISGIDTDPDGNVWCASAIGTLFEIGFSDSAFVKSRTELLNDGYNGNTCKWIKFSGKYLFFGTNKGLSVISRSKLRSQNPSVDYSFNEHNGYDLISAHSPFTDPNGRIYLHSENAVISIDTVFRAPGKAKLYINNLKINGRETAFSDGSDMDMNYGEKQIAFTFKILKYPSSKNFSYRYKVNSDEWINGNQVLLQSLRPGKYDIKMEGLNTEDMSTLQDSIELTVKPPFWWSAWFNVMIICVSILLFYFYMRFRIKRLNLQHEEKTKMVIRNSELQLRSLQIQMNPHFIFNALNAIQAFIMEKNTEDSLKYLNELSGIIRTNLENATEEYIFLTREIDFLKKYVRIEEMRFNDKLDVEFIEEFNDLGLKLPPMFIQPVIENAIKHGIRNREGKGTINIRFSQNKDTLSVTVEDNGAGREFAKTAQHDSHQGLSLKIIKQRLDLLNRKYGTDLHSIKITDLKENEIAAGTRVVINILARN